MPIALVMSSQGPTLKQAPSSGARLVATDGRELPLTGTSLRADAAGGIARTVVEQRFTNPHAEALTVTYSLPLPADGAVSGFAFRIAGRRIQGEVQKRADARAELERAILEGRTAALLEQDRSSLFTQEIGNIPPGETIVAEVSVDQPLRWLDEGAWEWRFPTVVAPRYLGEPGRVPDAERIAQDVAGGPVQARFTLACTVRDALANGSAPESPSHPMTLTTGAGARAPYRRSEAAERARAVDVANGGPFTLAIEEGARLDRDVVVRWKVASPRVGLSLQVGRPAAHRAHGKSAYGLITLVPPRAGAVAKVPRDLVVLLDTSGSMGGEPLEQAKRVTMALIDTLGPNDRLEMVEFSSRARRWRSAPAAASADVKRDALGWVRGLSAGGSTDMVEGILEALRPVRADAQRQVIVVTDGQIGFETQVISAICDKLPRSSRLHTVGVGSAVNRSLTGPAARVGRGVEVILGLGEDPERAAQRLLARTSDPLVVDLQIAGSAVIGHAPRHLPDLFAGAPALIAVALRPEGGEIVVRGRTEDGAWEQRLELGETAPASGSEAAAALFGRESIEDRELELAAGGARRSIDAEIERLGLDFQLATRLTSWIAVTREVMVDPRAGSRRERMPHELPHGMSAEGLGLRPPADGTLASADDVADGPIAALADEDEAFADGGFAPPLKEAALAGPAPAKAEAPAEARKNIDLKARLAGSTVGVPPAIPGHPTAGPAPAMPQPARPVAPMSAPKPTPAKQSVHVELDMAQAPLARSRRSTSFTAILLAFPIAFGVAFWLLGAWIPALAIAAAVLFAMLVVRAVLRRILG